jgi:hemolysin III
MKNYIREPINGLTHLSGAILALFALLAMVIKTTMDNGTALSITAVTIFGISMILLYTTSATYHMVMAKDTVIALLRRLDHSMIFILIAGTYAPYCLISLNGKTGWVLYTIIMVAGVAGVIFKMVWFHCPRWLSTLLYIVMGWMAITVISPLSKSIEIGGILLLILGGVLYTIGAVIYAVKPKFLEFKYFGFHEIFHIFILLGTLTHFLSIFMYVI